MNNTELGRLAETAVQNVYRKRGYRILAKNLYYGKIGELDIVVYRKAEMSESLVFCEVKCRRDFSFSDPLLAVNRLKRNRIFTMAQIFLQHRPEYERAVLQFDIALALPRGDSFFIEILENAF